MALTKLKGKRTPRSEKELLSTITQSVRLYLETGGQEIDDAISAAKATHALALKRAERYISPGDGSGKDPISEANRALQTWEKFSKQREQKLERCRKDLDEMDEHRAQAVAAEAPVEEDSPKPEQKHGEPVPIDEPEQSATQTTPEQNHDQASR